MTKDIFEFDSRYGLRYPSKNGPLTSHQLWALPLQSAKYSSLDGVAKTIYAELQAIGEQSFVNTAARSPEQESLEVALEVVKHIIAVKETENQAKVNAAKRRQEIQQLEEALAQDQADALKALSPEEKAKRLAELKAQQ